MNPWWLDHLKIMPADRSSGPVITRQMTEEEKKLYANVKPTEKIQHYNYNNKNNKAS